MVDTWVSFPNTPHNARAVTLGEHEQLAAPLGLSGLVDYSGTLPLFADSTGLHVKIRDNVGAVIRGTRFNTTAETEVAISSNSSGNTRIDLVVLRLDRADYTIDPVVIAGTPASSPIAPQPVRNPAGGTPDYYDIPLGEVTVINGATTITATQVKRRAWWITGDGLIGFSDGRPPVQAGVTLHEANTGSSYIGSVGGTWQRIYHYSDWVAMAAAPGWTIGTAVSARDGNTCMANLHLVRNGAAIAASVSPVVAAITASHRPARFVWGTYHCTNPNRVAAASLAPNGRITVAGNSVNPIKDGSTLIVNLPAWIVDDD